MACDPVQWTGTEARSLYLLELSRAEITSVLPRRQDEAATRWFLGGVLFERHSNRLLSRDGCEAGPHHTQLGLAMTLKPRRLRGVFEVALAVHFGEAAGVLEAAEAGDDGDRLVAARPASRGRP